MTEASGRRQNARFFGPTKWLTAASPLSATQRLVLMSLCIWANPRTGLCWPSVASLQRVTALAERTVRKALRALTSVGAIREATDQPPPPATRRYFVDGFPVPSNGAPDAPCTDLKRYVVPGRGASNATKTGHLVPPKYQENEQGKEPAVALTRNPNGAGFFRAPACD